MKENDLVVFSYRDKNYVGIITHMTYYATYGVDAVWDFNESTPPIIQHICLDRSAFLPVKARKNMKKMMMLWAINYIAEIASNMQHHSYYNVVFMLDRLGKHVKNIKRVMNAEMGK